MFNQKEYQKKWYRDNKDRLTEKMRRYRKGYYEENNQKEKKYRKDNKSKIKGWIKNHLNNPKMKQKDLVRKLTYYKYGKLPKGFQYHHTTEPYKVDEWIGIDTNEHYDYHSKLKAGELK